MADRYKVLVVDDSAVVRRVIGDAISGDPALEVAATAPNGRIAVERVAQLPIDLVILDVEMPDMDGLAALRAIRKLRPSLPVVMFSSLTERGARTTIEALTSGATDYVCKPKVTSGGPEAALRQIQVELLPRLRALGARARARGTTATHPLAITQTLPVVGGARPREARTDVVVIGVSTGGPSALGEVLPRLTAGFCRPVLIVQHMPPLFTRLLAERLAENCRVRVEEARHGRELQPGLVLIAPGDHHMMVARQTGEARVTLGQGPPENGCRPAIDPLFRSASEQYGAGVLALVLTGMGSDGLRGATAVKERGGRVWVQDEASAVVWSMPGSVQRAGLAERVLPLRDVGDALERAVKGDAATTGVYRTVG